MKRAGIVVLLLVAAATLYVGLRLSRAAGASAIAATTEVERGRFVDDLPLRGEIRPERSIQLTAPSAGGFDMQIVELVANGSRVKTGDIIVAFDTTTQQRTLEQKSSELEQALSEVDRAESEGARRVRAAEAELVLAESSAARARLDLGAAELLSKVDAEKRQIAVRKAERLVAELREKIAAEREAAAAEAAIARQKVDKMRYDVAETERIMTSLAIRAPSDGAVALLPNFRAGGPMSRSAPEFRRGDRAWSGAAIAELPDLSSVRMTLRVDEADRARLAVGGAAVVRVDALPEREFAARLAEISLVATPDFTSFPPVRNFDITVRLEDTDARLRSGMSATARIELDRIDDVLLIPTSALHGRGQAHYVYVERNGTFDERAVTVLRRGRDRTALASGVSPGERVAVQPPVGAGDER